MVYCLGLEALASSLPRKKLLGTLSRPLSDRFCAGSALCSPAFPCSEIIASMTPLPSKILHCCFGTPLVIHENHTSYVGNCGVSVKSMPADGCIARLLVASCSSPGRTSSCQLEVRQDRSPQAEGFVGKTKWRLHKGFKAGKHVHFARVLHFQQDCFHNQVIGACGPCSCLPAQKQVMIQPPTWLPAIFIVPSDQMAVIFYPGKLVDTHDTPPTETPI